MSPHERRLAVITAIAIIVIALLAFVPVSVLLTVIGPILLVCSVVSFVVLVRALAGPLTETDLECDRIDRELDAEEAEACRVARRCEREVSPIRRVGGWRR